MSLLLPMICVGKPQPNPPPIPATQDGTCVPSLPPFQDKPGHDVLASKKLAIFPFLEINCDGVVRQWSALVLDSDPSTIYFQVWRRATSDSSIFNLIGSNNAIDHLPEKPDRKVTLDVDSNDWIHVRAGDVIGLYSSHGVKSVPVPKSTNEFYSSEVGTADTINTSSIVSTPTDKFPLLSLDIGTQLCNCDSMYITTF